MKFPDLLATKGGRLTAFFALYMTEGIPLGFTATAIVAQMKRQGLGPEETGVFVSTLYLPWAFKWLMGPIVDVFSSDRFGRRRLWIVLTQVMMVLTLMAALPIDFTTQLKLFIYVILVHNIFSATQDVAIDALACSVLDEKERGLANGLMFGGAYLGQAIGGPGMLYLIPHTGIGATFVVVSAVLISVTLMIALPMREPKGPPRIRATGSPMRAAAAEVRRFSVEAGRSFVSSRAAWMGVIVALVPAGGYALSSSLQSNLAVDLGMSDTDLANLSLIGTIITAASCVAGGWVSDKLGRRRMLALYYVGMAVPGLWLATVMVRHGWSMPLDATASDKPLAHEALVTAFWSACLVFGVFQGLMYGTRSALFMDVTNSAVAGTQFTAYMAMLNLVIAYSALWQGLALKHWGYPTTLTIDGLVGLVVLGLLPFMSPAKKASAISPLPSAAAD